MSERLRAEQVTAGYRGETVLDRLDLRIRTGAITTIIGPNGSGKSTLLRILGRLLTPRSGRVLLDDKPIDSMRTRQVARLVGMLPQSPTAPDGLTVTDLVARGRHPHQSLLRQWSQTDELAVADALDQTGMSALADRPLDELSGGQRRRAWIAMAVAQGTDIMLLDEPTTYLDLAHSLEVLDLVDRLCREQGRTVVMVLHDLNLAIRYSDELVAMTEGRIVATGAPETMVNAELLQEVFGLRARIIDDPVSGGPLIVPIGSRTLDKSVRARA